MIPLQTDESGSVWRKLVSKQIRAVLFSVLVLALSIGISLRAQDQEKKNNPNKSDVI
jgi:hypothetical protein